MILTEGRLEQLAEIGCELNEIQKRQVEQYMEELELYNPSLSLVNYRGDEDLFVDHILDSLLPLDYFKTLHATRWADVGSGAGLPGILLAIALPEKSFTLIERSYRRCNFLETVRVRLKLVNVRVISQDLEQIQECFGAVVFRAFRPMGNFALLLKGILEEGGRLLAYKGWLEVAEAERMKVASSFSDSRIKVLKTPSQKERCLLILAR